MMMLIIVIGIIISMLLLLLRAFHKQSTMYDRILIANAFGTKTMILIVVMGVLAEDAMFLDIALIYALVNFITTIGFLKYFHYRSLGKK